MPLPLDPISLGITASVAQAGLVMALWLSYSRGPRLPGMLSLIAGMGCIALGTVVILARQALPMTVSILVGNSLWFIAFGLVYDGCLRFFALPQERLRRMCIAGIAASAIAGVTWYTLVEENLGMRGFVHALAIGGMSLAGGLNLLHYSWRRRESRVDVANWIIIVALLAMALLQGVRLLEMHALLIYHDFFDFLRNDKSVRFILLYTAFFSVILTAAFRTLYAERTLAVVERLANMDPLTNIPNRRSFMERAQQAVVTAVGHGEPLCLAIFDVDHFKAVNDTYGHGVGDEVLQDLAALCSGNLREHDTVGRIGGEEFALCMARTTLEQGMAVCERMLNALRLARLSTTQPELKITASIGVAAWMPGETVEACLSRADAALYAAKEGGRNQVRGTDDAAAAAG